MDGAARRKRDEVDRFAVVDVSHVVTVAPAVSRRELSSADLAGTRVKHNGPYTWSTSGSQGNAYARLAPFSGAPPFSGRILM